MAWLGAFLLLLVAYRRQGRIWLFPYFPCVEVRGFEPPIFRSRTERDTTSLHLDGAAHWFYPM